MFNTNFFWRNFLPMSALMERGGVYREGDVPPFSSSSPLCMVLMDSPFLPSLFSLLLLILLSSNGSYADLFLLLFPVFEKKKKEKEKSGIAHSCENKSRFLRNGGDVILKGKMRDIQWLLVGIFHVLRVSRTVFSPIPNIRLLLPFDWGIQRGSSSDGPFCSSRPQCSTHTKTFQCFPTGHEITLH